MSNIPEFVNPMSDERRQVLLAELGAKMLDCLAEAGMAVDADTRSEWSQRANSYGFVRQLIADASEEVCASVEVLPEHIVDGQIHPAETRIGLKSGETIRIIRYHQPLGWFIVRLAERLPGKGGRLRALGSIGVSNFRPIEDESAFVSVKFHGYEWTDFTDLHPADVHSLVQRFEALAPSQA